MWAVSRDSSPTFLYTPSTGQTLNARFEELDFSETPLGELILRRRHVLSLDTDVYEVKLDGSFLMSSFVNTSEIALADQCLRRFDHGPIDVAIGGLGLGYTAQAALANRNVKSVLVIEYLSEIIGWHKRKLIPAASSLVDDARCRFVNGDFFALISNPELGLDLESEGRRFDAILVDIDHAPDYVLDPSHESFYDLKGLTLLSEHLKPGGVFGLWSADDPEEEIIASLGECFASSDAEVITFPNPLLNMDDRNTIYIAQNPIPQRNQ